MNIHRINNNTTILTVLVEVSITEVEEMGIDSNALCEVDEDVLTIFVDELQEHILESIPEISAELIEDAFVSIDLGIMKDETGKRESLHCTLDFLEDYEDDLEGITKEVVPTNQKANNKTKKVDGVTNYFVFEYTNYEDLTSLLERLANDYTGTLSLYYLPEHDKMYVVLFIDNSTNYMVNILSEYIEILVDSYILVGVLGEYGKCVMEKTPFKDVAQKWVL